MFCDVLHIHYRYKQVICQVFVKKIFFGGNWGFFNKKTESIQMNRFGFDNLYVNII